MLLALAFIAAEKLKWKRTRENEGGQMGFHMFFCVHVHAHMISFLSIPRDYN